MANKINLILKRFLDIVLSLFFIVLLIPVWIIILVLIKLDSKGTVLYKQKRVGLNGLEFECLKFRTMFVQTDEETLPQDPFDKRITRIGKFLRNTSLDETTQLINVLFGHMSIVGPRPALPSQVKEFLPSEFDKLLVKPGLTGWTQINGRNSLPYKKRLELDTWYARNWNILLDIKILLKTPFVILKQEGIYDRN